jgi:hypothetical protein
VTPPNAVLESQTLDFFVLRAQQIVFAHIAVDYFNESGLAAGKTAPNPN